MLPARPGGRPRILQVVHSLSAGGTERVVMDLIARGRRDCEMAVCCLDAAGAWGERLAASGVPVWVLGRAPGFHPSLAWHIRQHARAFGAHVLHCHQYSPFVYGRLAGALAGVPVVMTEHGRLSDAPPSPRRRRVNRLLTRGVPAIHAVSDELRAFMRQEGYPARIRVVRNGVDPGTAPAPDARATLRASWGMADDAFVIGVVARLDPVKDLATLLDAVAAGRRAGRPWHLIVAGDGPERPALHARAQLLGLGPSVCWLGAVPDGRAVLPGVDVSVNTSISEGVSITILEAMAAGLPVVASAVGGTPEVIAHDVTGLLVPPRTPSVVTDALMQLEDDPGLRRRLGASAAEHVRAECSLDRMVGHYLALYRQLAGVDA